LRKENRLEKTTGIKATMQNNLTAGGKAEKGKFSMKKVSRKRCKGGKGQGCRGGNPFSRIKLLKLPEKGRRKKRGREEERLQATPSEKKRDWPRS